MFFTHIYIGVNLNGRSTWSVVFVDHFLQIPHKQRILPIMITHINLFIVSLWTPFMEAILLFLTFALLQRKPKTSPLPSKSVGFFAFLIPSPPYTMYSFTSYFKVNIVICATKTRSQHVHPYEAHYCVYSSSDEERCSFSNHSHQITTANKWMDEQLVSRGHTTTMHLDVLMHSTSPL